MADRLASHGSRFTLSVLVANGDVTPVAVGDHRRREIDAELRSG